MDLQLGEARYPRGVRIDNVATRYEYVLSAYYVLKSASSGAIAKQGTVRVELTYDSADQPYASISAQQDAQDRAADEAARRIELELAVWLANGAKVAAR
jgi:LPS-assembly lipoprotein